MEFMQERVAHSVAPKSVHKPDLDLTKKERSYYFDDAEASIVPVVLARDECFQGKGRLIATTNPSDRLTVAQREAKAYAPYKGPHQDLMVRLLLLMSEEPWLRWGEAARETFFANVLRRPGVWADAPLDENDGRRVRRRWTTLKRGAQRLARLGAGRCIACGGSLSASRCQARPRVTHCSSCTDKYSMKVRDTHRSEIREALDAATGHRRHRRAARRAA